MLLLLAASLISWTMIFRKWSTFKTAKRAAARFEGRFWSGGNINQMFKELSQNEDNLFGMVWGIMNSFHALSSVQQATIASVAPGIAEALIATAMGLFAAIPAVIAYNRYSHDAESLFTRYEIFMEEFASILQRQAFLSKA